MNREAENPMVDADELVMDKTDMLVEILSHLDLDDLRRCASVCHTWRSVLHDVWGSLWQRCLQWESEESFLESDSGGGRPNHHPPTTAADDDEYHWEPTRSFRHIQWGNGKAVLDLARDAELRRQVLGEEKPSQGPKEAVHSSPLRDHVMAVDTSLAKWISALASAGDEPSSAAPLADETEGITDDGLDSSSDEELPSESMLYGPGRAVDDPSHQRAGEGSLGLCSVGSVVSYSDAQMLHAEPQSSASHRRPEETNPVEGECVADPLASPGVVFPVSFICAASELLAGHCPPPPVRVKRLLLIDESRGSRPPGSRPVRRSLTFDSPQGEDSEGVPTAQRPARVSAQAVARFHAPATVGKCKQLLHSSGDAQPAGLQPQVTLPPALSRRLLATASIMTPVGYSAAAGHQGGAAGSSSSSRASVAEQLGKFAKCHSVTKFVDLLGTRSKASRGGRDPSVCSFVQKVVSQVRHGSTEVRIVQTFGWQRSSAQWLSLGDGQEAAGQTQPAGRWAGAGDVVITQLEHRYSATLQVVCRSVEHSRPDVEWQELLHMSHRTDLNFSPDETLRLQRPQLDALRGAWGLTSLGDEAVLRLLVVLGGRQPQHMGSLLEHLFRSLDGAAPSQAHQAGVHVQQEGGSPAPFCSLCRGECLGAQLLGDLPRLWCMTDPSLVEDLSWVMALASD